MKQHREMSKCGNAEMFNCENVKMLLQNKKKVLLASPILLVFWLPHQMTKYVHIFSQEMWPKWHSSPHLLSCPQGDLIRRKNMRHISHFDGNLLHTRTICTFLIGAVRRKVPRLSEVQNGTVIGYMTISDKWKWKWKRQEGEEKRNLNSMLNDKRKTDF